MDEVMNISFHLNEDAQSHPANREQLIYDWTVDELKTLCGRIKDETLRMAKALNAVYTKTENRLDWESIAFGNHDADECRTKWQQVCTNIRTFRTMAEIVQDAEQWLHKGPRKAKEAKVMGKSHPDKPARPPTIFFKFLMEQLPIVKSKYPELTHRQIVSRIGQIYKTLPAKKIAQLKGDFSKEQESYRIRLEQFYDAHPDVAPIKGPTGVAPKGTSGLAFFIAEKMQQPKYANATKEDLREKWAKLKDEKKITYIEMALAAHCRNSGGANFIAKPSKDVLSKDERVVYDRFLEKPDKPPTSGFALFKSIACATKYQDLSVSERNKKIQLSWNGMSRPDQNKFNNEVKIFKQQYDRKMAEYLERLQKRERELTENVINNCNNKGTIGLQKNHAGSPAKRAKVDESPTKGVAKAEKQIVKARNGLKKSSKLTALTWYQQNNLSEWKQLNPELSEKEILEAITKQFSELSDKKKQKWARRAEEENQRRQLH